MLRPNNLWSTSPLSLKSTIETTLRKFPRMPKWVVLGKLWMVTVECVHTVLPQKALYRLDMAWRPAHASQTLGGLVHTCLQTKILVPPQELVPGFLCAVSKWSRLIQTNLGCITCCTWCDHPRWSCISRCTVHRWQWSWSVVVLNTCHVCILLTLPYVGVDGKQIVPM